jgi:hypothetical protein
MENIRAEAGATINAGMAPPLTQATASVTAALGPSEFAVEFAAGKRLSRDAAATLALGEAGPAGRQFALSAHPGGQHQSPPS